MMGDLKVDLDVVKLGLSLYRICKKMLALFKKIVKVFNLGLYFKQIVNGVDIIWFSKMNQCLRKYEVKNLTINDKTR